MVRFLLLFSISFIVGHQAHASSLSLVDAAAPRAWISKGVTAQVVTDAPSGDGTSSSAPTTLYIPINSGSNSNYSILSDPANQMPQFAIVWAGTIYTELHIDNTGGNATTLYAAVQDTGSTYKLIEMAGHPVLANSESDETYGFSMSDFCNVAGCSNGSITTLDRLVFFFLSESQPSSSFSIDSKTGLYFKFRFSSIVNSQIPLLDNARKGDERLNLYYSNAPILADYYETLVFSYTDLITTKAAGTYGAIKNNGLIVSNKTDSSMHTSGYVTLMNLENGQKVNVAIAFSDKFQFATSFTGSLIATPEQIDIFLEKQGCYLLSAGFQEEHYVIDYFKKFRDQILLKHSLGKKFVHFYYATAPHYAHYIYNSPTLSSFVRGVAFCLYFAFNYVYCIFIGITVFISIFVFRYFHKAYRQA